jgi:hypothetical protein
MSKIDHSTWFNGDKKTPQAARRSKRIDIAMHSQQKCCWEGCENPPVRRNAPFCEKHLAKYRGDAPCK